MIPFRYLQECSLYGILDTGYLQDRDPSMVATQMLEGGVQILQVRAKKESLTEITWLIEKVRHVTQRFKVPLIINDYPQIAAAIGADGVHVGQNDLSVSEVRQIIGKGKWVGKSTHSLDQAMAGVAEGADYIGVGPVFATPTKPDYCPVGLNLVSQVSSRVQIPFFCIGGIVLENAHQVLEAGAKRIVVVSGILKAPDIVQYCRNLRQLLDTNGL